ncbi:Fis family transcriptional regulator [Aquibium carbonis]|uniref:Fis family transcriptional regulator n=1 Tax=Aquibium carbonis TaxID=2495581 RepID=A0A429YUS0_9HYPH|nr:helix-turn-helix transcriptional regulator [Aquibium carbonis]RST85213.1 Fis family transcriptional regulator [Aquibium carbonis]
MTDLGKSTVGETLEDVLEGLGEREEVYGEALKRVIAWQIETARKGAGLSKSEIANRLGTSRSQVDRILDPTNVAVSLASLERAARAVGKRLRIEIVDP